MKIKCESCGQVLDGEHPFCWSCGKRVSGTPEFDGSVSHKFYSTAWKKIQRLQEDGLKCVEIVLESEDGKTAHVDQWGKVTWDR